LPANISIQIRQKDGSRFKVSSLKAIKTAIDRYLRKILATSPGPVRLWLKKRIVKYEL